MDILRLQKLADWLDIKVQSMKAEPNPNEYGDAALSKEILEYLKYSIHREMEVMKIVYNPDPHFAQNVSSIGIGGHTTPYKTETICSHCKALYPQHTHCVHRMTY